MRGRFVYRGQSICGQALVRVDQGLAALVAKGFLERWVMALDGELFRDVWFRVGAFPGI
jgi:hypothetical protein